MATEHAQKIHELLDDADTAMLVTESDEGVPHARPMALACVDQNCDVWFFTARGNPMIREIQNDQRVLIVCQDAPNRFVALAGRAELVVDRSLAHRFWRDEYSKWFSGGLDDPKLLLIHVHAESGEYWDDAHPSGARHEFAVIAPRREIQRQPEL